MILNNKKTILLVAMFLLICLNPLFAKKQLKDDVILRMVERALRNYPEKIKKLPPNVERVVIFSLKVDKQQISQSLFKQVQGKLESIMKDNEVLELMYAPEVKLFKIVSKGDVIHFKSNFQTTKEIKEISKDLRIDGFLEGDLYITDNNEMYINLRIFDVNTMAVVWTEQFSTAEKVIEAKEFGADLGFGLSGLQVVKTNNTLIELPEFVEYYNIDLRILQRAYLQSKVKLTLSGGLMPLVKGVNSTEKTLVSGDTLFNYYGKLGVRVSLFSPTVPKDEQEPFLRDWLAMELSFGKMFALGVKELNMFGVRLETNITKNVSFSAGLSYIPYKVIQIGSSGDVKVGGFMYEISLLRINILY